MWNIFVSRMFSKRKKNEIRHEVWNLFVTVFKKRLFEVKLLTKK